MNIVSTFTENINGKEEGQLDATMTVY